MLVNLQEKYPRISAFLDGSFLKRDYVSATLSAAPKDEPIIQKKELDYLSATLMSPDRVRLPFTAETSIYDGGWFLQKGPTCTPWAIAGGMLALGVYPKRKVMRELYTKATKHNDPKKKGLELSDAIVVVQKHTNSIEFAPTDPFKMSRWDPQRKQDDRYSQLFYRAGLHENAKAIKDAINQRKVLLLSVRTSHYIAQEGSGYHAVTVVGFRISQDGFFDVQIIDPARGRLWMSLEHLAQALSNKKNFTMQRKN